MTAMEHTATNTRPGLTPQAANAVISLSLYNRPKASKTATNSPNGNITLNEVIVRSKSISSTISPEIFPAEASAKYSAK